MSKFFKLWVGAFAAAVFLCALSFNVYAAGGNCGAITATYPNGENLTYTIDGNTLTISGSGDMNDYGINLSDKSPFYDNTTLTTIVWDVKDGGITHIGNYAFYGCSGLESITIPDSITSIGLCQVGTQHFL